MKIQGQLYRKGQSWYGRWREVIDGERVQRAMRLCDYDRTLHGTRKRPDDVERIFDEIVLDRLNAGKSAPKVSPAVKIERGIAPDSDTLVGQFVDHTFFPNMKTFAQPKTGAPLRASTLKDYGDVWRCHLQKRIAHMPLADFSVHDGDLVLADIQRSNPAFTGETLKRIKALMHRIFGEAVRVRALDVNPMAGVSTPAGEPSTETLAYSSDEVQHMLSVLQEPARTIVALAAFAGLRKSEIRGLRWEDYRDDKLHVERTLWRCIENGPKTRSSKAAVSVIPRLAAMLAPKRKKIGPMFAGVKGKPLNLDNLYRRTMKDILVAKKIQWHGWHGFRSHLSTLLNEKGTDIKTVQGIMRHSEPAVTLNHYVKESETLQKAALVSLDDLCTPCAPATIH